MTNFFEKDSQIKIFQPELKDSLLFLSSLVTSIFRYNLLNESSSSLIQLLGLDISPCMQLFIVECLEIIIDPKDDDDTKKIIDSLLSNGFLEIILSVFIHGLYDVKIEIIRLLSSLIPFLSYKDHEDLKENNQESMFAILKENIIPFNLLQRNNFFFASLSQGK